MKLSKNFTIEEMIYSKTAEIKGIDNVPLFPEKDNLKNLCTNILQPIRDALNMPIIVTSGYRCDSLNRAVHGSKNSQHIKGEAADIKCRDMQKLWDICLDLIKNGDIEVGQLINEKNLSWIHISLPRKNRINNEILYL